MKSKLVFNDKLISFALKVIFILILVMFGIISFIRGGIDFRGYYGAAVVVTRGGNPYNYAELAPVLEEVTGSIGNNPYFYPPWYCLLFIPFTLLPFNIARLVWIFANLLLFYFSMELLRKYLNWPQSEPKKWALYLFAFLLFGVYCILSEQAGILMLFGLALFLYALSHQQPVLAGLGLLIFATKPQVTALVVIAVWLWLLRNQKKAAWSFAGWGIFATIVATIAIPGWWQIKIENFGLGLSYTLESVDTWDQIRLFSTAYDFLGYSLGILPPVQYILVALIGVGGLLIIKRTNTVVRSPENWILSVLIFSYLLTPLALQYDYVPLCFVLYYLLRHVGEISKTKQWIVGLLLMFSFSVLMWQIWSYEGYLQIASFSIAFAILIFSLSPNQDALASSQ